MENVWAKKNRTMLVAGHRGACALAPENTLPSFELAINLGVDGLETDIWMTRDGHLVLLHDGDVKRTTNGSGCIRDMTLAEARQLDAGIRFSPEFQNTPIPLLEEFLELVQGKDLMLNLEIKDGRRAVVDAVLSMLERRGIGDCFLINSGDGEITTYAHQRYGVKTQGYPQKYYQKNFREEFYRGMYAVGIPMSDLSPEICREYVGRGIEPWCWCPDDEVSARHAVKCGALLATCNDPRAALNISKKS